MALHWRVLPVRRRSLSRRLRRTRLGRLRSQRARRGPADQVEGASEVRRSRFHAALRQLAHPPTRPRRPTGPHARAAPRRAAMAPSPPDSGHRGRRRGRRPRPAVRDSRVDLISFDIYVSPNAQFIGDGHAIPISDNAVDGVVSPGCARACVGAAASLRKRSIGFCVAGGSSTPTPLSSSRFTEGPFDFTRFTRQRPPVPVPRLRADRLRHGGRRRYGVAVVDQLFRPGPDPLGAARQSRRRCASSGSATSTDPRPAALG